MKSRGERFCETLAVLARRGIGVVDEELIKNEAGYCARSTQRRVCE